MERIEAFLAYVAQYRRGFLDEIAGATQHEVDTLSSLTGHVLPEFYEQFLLHLGRRDGGLDLGAGASTAIRDVLAYYDEIVRLREQDVALPPDCTVIAVSGLDVPELSIEAGDAQQRVVSTSGRRILHPVAASLEHLLYRTAFIDFRASMQASRATYYVTLAPEVWARARDLAEREGFRREWFSDDWSFCGEVSQTLIAINLVDAKYVWVRLASPDPGAVATLGDRFQRALGLARR
ncbi:MAG TPA: hypothetical protein VGD56_14970 [Gemmatirosa sp.]